MSPEDRALLREMLKNDKNPNGDCPDVAVYALEEMCARTGLNWKQRQIYLINRGGKWRPEVSIDGFRLVAESSPEYAGQEATLWAMSPEGPWTDIPPDKTPYAAKVGVVKQKDGVRSTTYGQVKYKDYDPGTSMWRKMGATMIAKCAEMLALRKALPGKLSGVYGTEEMEQIDAKPVKSARNSTPKEEQDPDNAATEKEFEKAIASCETYDPQLRELGAEISRSHLGLQAKQRLSILFNNKKAELQEATGGSARA